MKILPGYKKVCRRDRVAKLSQVVPRWALVAIAVRPQKLAASDEVRLTVGRRTRGAHWPQLSDRLGQVGNLNTAFDDLFDDSNGGDVLWHDLMSVSAFNKNQESSDG